MAKSKNLQGLLLIANVIKLITQTPLLAVFAAIDFPKKVDRLVCIYV